MLWSERKLPKSTSHLSARRILTRRPQQGLAMARQNNRLPCLLLCRIYYAVPSHTLCLENDGKNHK